MSLFLMQPPFLGALCYRGRSCSWPGSSFPALGNVTFVGLEVASLLALLFRRAVQINIKGSMHILVLPSGLTHKSPWLPTPMWLRRPFLSNSNSKCAQVQALLSTLLCFVRLLQLSVQFLLQIMQQWCQNLTNAKKHGFEVKEGRNTGTTSTFIVLLSC